MLPSWTGTSEFLFIIVLVLLVFSCEQSYNLQIVIISIPIFIPPIFFYRLIALASTPEPC